jgi:hypothetical protein
MSASSSKWRNNFQRRRRDIFVAPEITKPQAPAGWHIQVVLLLTELGISSGVFLQICRADGAEEKCAAARIVSRDLMSSGKREASGLRLL